MKKLVFVFVGVTIFTGVGHAGLQGTYSVSINTALQLATGGLASARASANINTHIGCYSSITANPGTSYYGFCQARDDAGTNAMCTTTNPDLVLQMARLQGDARLTFDWDASGACTRIIVRQSSTQAPKEP